MIKICLNIMSTSKIRQLIIYSFHEIIIFLHDLQQPLLIHQQLLNIGLHCSGASRRRLAFRMMLRML